MRAYKYFVFIIWSMTAFDYTLTLLNNGPSVAIPLGKINGCYKKSADGRQYAAYESIPYALKPIGELRFQPPVPISNNFHEIDALKLPGACTQFDSIRNVIAGEEDCLYLNVYTPAKNASERLPVIFWIAGGGFQYGSGSKYGAKFLMDRNIILVTFNYRVGPFGFLSTGDEVVPGNMGLKDQALALKWVSENIKYFGGDSKKVTLTGVSAGGASVHHHYLSPMSAGLFQNGISFSGTTLSPWAFANDTTETTKTLARAFNCPTDKSTTMIQCLRGIPALTIAKMVKKLLSDLYFSYVVFPPVAERGEKDCFINDSPKNILEKGFAHDLPWMATVVSEEGLYITSGFALNETMMEHTDEYWERLAPYMLHYANSVPTSKHSLIANSAKKYYLGGRTFSTNKQDIKDLTHLAGDHQIVIDAVRAAKLQARVNKSPVWFYFYSYRANQSASDSMSQSTENLGVCHDDDVYLVLENKSIDPTISKEDRAMSNDFLDLWYSFANNGTPDLGIEWPRIDGFSENFQYLYIAGSKNFTIKNNNNLGQRHFWESLGFGKSAN